jgi:uroporphyrin-III C-methyltransferase/precorrin-2 dehydrogenase/sirohydrochlorin ferrochelatase/uroporphyrin-III C-methyltransferase
MNTAKPTGRVIFAGAGPGDPELLTLKAHRYLQQADVVISDRLVSDHILEEYVRKEALVLHVGKQGNHPDSTPQGLISELLVDYASQGLLVVRLKGGDVSVFSNILDELQALVAHQISYEIIPGITAGLGAAACAGIPLTARGYSDGVRFLTFYRTDVKNDQYWKDLAVSGDTLVFYMSGATLGTLVHLLVGHGISADTFISVVEQATTPMQRVFTCNIHDFSKECPDRSFVSPSLVIVGKVAGLENQFRWLPENSGAENYFKPLGKVNKTEARA